jgi:hypothetical protein
LYWEWDDNSKNWNEGCAYAVEHFGLPGDKFTTEVTEDWMLFKFNDSRDALMFIMGVS